MMTKHWVVCNVREVHQVHRVVKDMTKLNQAVLACRSAHSDLDRPSVWHVRILLDKSRCSIVEVLPRVVEVAQDHSSPSVCCVW